MKISWKHQIFLNKARECFIHINQTRQIDVIKDIHSEFYAFQPPFIASGETVFKLYFHIKMITRAKLDRSLSLTQKRSNCD